MATVSTVTKSGLDKILDTANSALGVLSTGFTIFSTKALTDAQIGLFDAQKNYYNLQSNIVNQTYAAQKDAQTESEILNNAKRRYLYNQATPDDLKLLIKYDLINGYIDTDGNAVVTSNLMENKTQNAEIAEIAKSQNTNIFSKQNLMIAASVYLLYKILK